MPTDVSVTLVSDAYVFFEIEGDDAKALLAIASPVDIDAMPRKFATFTEAFGQKALPIGREGSFEVAAENSYSPMIEDCLSRAIGSLVLERIVRKAAVRGNAIKCFAGSAGGIALDFGKFGQERSRAESYGEASCCAILRQGGELRSHVSGRANEGELSSPPFPKQLP